MASPQRLATPPKLRCRTQGHLQIKEACESAFYFPELHTRTCFGITYEAQVISSIGMGESLKSQLESLLAGKNLSEGGHRPHRKWILRGSWHRKSEATLKAIAEHAAHCPVPEVGTLPGPRFRRLGPETTTRDGTVKVR